ncbi:hypothetical protein EXE43_17570 [Halorubrum sp. SS5]|uniref:DUF6788 domain-containing protein n=1 Tax=Halorubrum salinarum TaxID=2739057 RepID=A0A7D3YG40_9EURY|nr:MULTISPECIES: hypothetical protein [Halorubrum]QKG94268.1 hypothetical protein HPS36_15355 [Halorubrum salinarum]TKX52805.1 hypothetical protein EXE42_15350 [Halorubrum sp. SP3]TKX57301.1 hypothetical protein EXE44_11110 [Halorubrum sp. SS7]TKX84685.1 hypothetical protein EXE43_17570 [Halorubrum sp. SS5]
MSHKPPTPPADLSTEMVDKLNSYSPEQLRYVAHYAEALASHKARGVDVDEESGDDESDEQPDDFPDDVPTKATITIKEINDNRYYYWQWRTGSSVKSKYKGPVDPDE